MILTVYPKVVVHYIPILKIQPSNLSHCHKRRHGQPATTPRPRWSNFTMKMKWKMISGRWNRMIHQKCGSCRFKSLGMWFVAPKIDGLKDCFFESTYLGEFEHHRHTSKWGKMQRQFRDQRWTSHLNSLRSQQALEEVGCTLHNWKGNANLCLCKHNFQRTACNTSYSILP